MEHHRPARARRASPRLDAHGRPHHLPVRRRRHLQGHHHRQILVHRHQGRGHHPLVGDEPQLIGLVPGVRRQSVAAHQPAVPHAVGEDRHRADAAAGRDWDLDEPRRGSVNEGRDGVLERLNPSRKTVALDGELADRAVRPPRPPRPPPPPSPYPFPRPRPPPPPPPPPPLASPPHPPPQL